MKIVFMGTPDFAVPTLKGLLKSKHEVVAVVTQPDRPKGRGRKLAQPPIKEAGLAAGVPVLQPLSMKDPTFLEELHALNADCFIVVAFRILPSCVYEMPPMGTFNLHTSLLPQYRGAAPMQWAIMNGEIETGLTTFMLDRRVDTGAILMQKKVEIFPDDTLGSLHDRMSALGVELVLETLNGLEDNCLEPLQQSGDISQAPKILPEHTLIKWDWPVEKIINRIRGLSPIPGAMTYWKGLRLKFYKGLSISEPAGNSAHIPGTVLSISGKGLIIKATTGCVNITELQLEGKKRMDIEAFSRGCSMQYGDTFNNLKELQN
ncbi:methionyl-tRNA formyltransferase [bacterium]|nr:methionyl-tRNA formyltransferase [bacterium]